MSSHHTHPISIDGSGVTHHPDTSNVLLVDYVSSCDKCRVAINILPDDVLLLIFHFDRVTYIEELEHVSQPEGVGGPRMSWRRNRSWDELRRSPGWHRNWRWHRSLWWHRLAHVCRRWRSVVFASPNFLDLTLVCDPWTRVEHTTIWPPLPIIIRDMDDFPMPEDYDFDAAIVHQNRVCEIDLLRLTNSQLQRLASSMQEQFPALIHLTLFANVYSIPAPALPDGFLGGSAPSLQSLRLQAIVFPALPKLLLSATDLVRLTLWGIRDSGYISHEAIVTCLAVLANLKYFSIEYMNNSLFHPNRERGPPPPPPPTPTVLSVLNHLEFRGVSEYLEDFVARIDAPLLDSLWITVHLPIFRMPQLAQFIRRTTRLGAFNEVHVVFSDPGVQVESHPPTWTFDEKSGFRISCAELDREWLDELEQFFTLFYPFIHMVEHLFIHGSRSLLSEWEWEEGSDDMRWIEMFHPFTTLKNLYIIKEFAEAIAPALQELVEEERVTDMLPALESLFLEEIQPSGPIQEAIGEFVAARQLAGHPITVSLWERDPEWDRVNNFQIEH